MVFLAWRHETKMIFRNEALWYCSAVEDVGKIEFQFGEIKTFNVDKKNISLSNPVFFSSSMTIGVCSVPLDALGKVLARDGKMFVLAESGDAAKAAMSEYLVERADFFVAAKKDFDKMFG